VIRDQIEIWKPFEELAALFHAPERRQTLQFYHGISCFWWSKESGAGLHNVPRTGFALLFQDKSKAV
jgi:hypothetical protein